MINNTADGDTLVMLKGSPTDPNAAVIHNSQLRALTPLYESGARVMGYENWTQGWDPAIARRSMDQALTQLNYNVQGVVSSNDGDAGAAMEEQGKGGYSSCLRSGLYGSGAAADVAWQTHPMWLAPA
ncbi:MAG: substrate-binding domain-containing protein [Aliishimia sp.]